VCDFGDEHGEAGRQCGAGADYPAAHVTDAPERLVASQACVGSVAGGLAGFASVIHRYKQNHPAVREP
jgi:hypothetical protein